MPPLLCEPLRVQAAEIAHVEGVNGPVATAAARQREMRSLPRVSRNCPCHDHKDKDEGKETGSRVKH